MTALKNRLQAGWEQVVATPKNVKLFLITVVTYGIAIEGISAVLLNLYLLRLGYGTEFIGTLNSVGLFLFALISLPIGAVQRYSSRQMIQFGQIISLVGLVGLPLAQYVVTGQAYVLIFFRILAMVGLSAYFVHQLPFAMEITKPAWHDRILAWTMAAFSLAAFLGSWLGGVLPELFSQWLDLPMSDPRVFQLPMFTATIVLIPALLSVWSIPEKRNDENIGENGKDGEGETAVSEFSNWRAIAGLLITIVIVRAFQTSGVGVIQTFYNVYFDDALHVPTSQIGLVGGFGRLLGVPVSLTIPWLVARYGNFKLVTISLILIALLILPIALIPSWPIAAVAYIGINSMGSLRYLSFIVFTMSLVNEKQRSLISGAGEMAIGAGFAVSSFVGGYMIAWYGYRELFLFGITMTLIGTIAFWFTFRKRAAKIAQPPAPVPN